MDKGFIEEHRAYTAIVSEKCKYGVFHKTCFHLHTPESHDFQLFENWSMRTYKEKTAQEIYDICCERKVFPPIFAFDDLDGDLLQGFSDRKQLLSFLLLADSILNNEISMVIVTDHHTIAGIPKLKKTIEYLHPLKPRKVFPEILLGIEVSCADKHHVVGIFEDSHTSKEKIETWLDEHLLNLEDGSFETSREVLKFVYSIKGVGYISHLDTANTFSEKSLSGAYKTKLFSEISIIGISDINQINYIRSKIREHTKNAVNFLIDNDSHAIDTLGQKHIWIKCFRRVPTPQTGRRALSPNRREQCP